MSSGGVYVTLFVWCAVSVCDLPCALLRECSHRLCVTYSLDAGWRVQRACVIDNPIFFS